MENKKKTPKNKQLVLIAAACLIILTIVLIAVIFLKGKKKPVIEPETSSPSVSETIEETTEAVVEKGEILPEMKELKAKNPDIYAWLSVPGTNVSQPVMFVPDDKDKDPEWNGDPAKEDWRFTYIRRNFEKDFDRDGIPWIDDHTLIDSDKEPDASNYLIYGHDGIVDKNMFFDLFQYKEEAFYKEHKKIEFKTLYKEDEYEIVAVFPGVIYDKRFEKERGFRYYDEKYTQIADEPRFNEYVENIQKLSLYDTGVKPKFGDQLISLSFCDRKLMPDKPEHGRMVVVARRVDK